MNKLEAFGYWCLGISALISLIVGVTGIFIKNGGGIIFGGVISFIFFVLILIFYICFNNYGYNYNGKYNEKRDEKNVMKNMMKI